MTELFIAETKGEIELCELSVRPSVCTNPLNIAKDDEKKNPEEDGDDARADENDYLYIGPVIRTWRTKTNAVCVKTVCINTYLSQIPFAQHVSSEPLSIFITIFDYINYYSIAQQSFGELVQILVWIISLCSVF